MTNAFVRVKREDGDFEPVEIDQLTDDEMSGFIASQKPEDGWRWARFLAAWVRDNIIKEAK